MKKVLFCLWAVMITATVWAAPPVNPVAEKIKSAFELQFAGATNVSWSTTNDVTIVSFKLNSNEVTAWYNEEGDLEAVKRTVTLSQVTLPAANAIKELHYQPSNPIYEVLKQGELFYLIKTSNSRFSTLYRVTVAGDVYKLERKKIKD